MKTFISKASDISVVVLKWSFKEKYFLFEFITLEDPSKTSTSSRLDFFFHYYLEIKKFNLKSKLISGELYTIKNPLLVVSLMLPIHIIARILINLNYLCRRIKKIIRGFI